MMKNAEKYIFALCISVLLLFSACAKKDISSPAVPAAPEPPAVHSTASADIDLKGLYFTVFCRTEDGKPVSGARIQVCNGSLCRMLTADENGLITYYYMPGEALDVTPVNAPKGYVLVSDRAVAVTENGQRIEFAFRSQTEDKQN